MKIADRIQRIRNGAIKEVFAELMKVHS